MKFMRVGPFGSERPVVQKDGRWFSTESIVADLSRQFWVEDGPTQVARALQDSALPPVSLEGMRVGPPIARPSLILCVGMNYAAHAAESGAPPPTEPIMFLKAPNTWAGPNDDVAVPSAAIAVDWEVELGVVIGSSAAFLESSAAGLSAVGGYFAANDLSERVYQVEHSGGQWSKGKCLTGFAPAGPFLVTPDEFDPSSARLQSWVNGEARQDSTTADMIFDVGTLVHRLSHYVAFEPGDVILTGTPEGVALSGRFPYLRAGDVVEIEIAGLGRQRQKYVAR